MLVSVPPSDFAINKEKVSCHLRGKPRGSWPRGARNPPARGHKKSSLRSPDSKLQTTGPEVGLGLGMGIKKGSEVAGLTQFAG